MELTKYTPYVMQYFVLAMDMMTNVEADEQYLIRTIPYHIRKSFKDSEFTADLSIPFVIDIKAFREAFVMFYDKNNIELFSVLFGGWENSKTLALNTADSRSVDHEGKILDPTYFQKFKMEVKNAALSVYKLDCLAWQLLVKLENITMTQTYFFGLYSKHDPAEWILYTQDKNRKEAWRTDTWLVNKILVESSLWIKTAENLGICALYCNTDSRCKSLNFNSVKKMCQGHDKNCDMKSTENFTYAINHVHYCWQAN